MADLTTSDQAARTRVLIVADNQIFLKAALPFLDRDADLLVVDVNQGDQDSLEGIEGHNPQIILLDLDISNQKGLEIISQIREAFPLVAIIALSMFDGDGCRRAALSAGANAVVHKLDLSVKLLPTIHLLSMNGLLEGDKDCAMQREIGPN